VVTTSTVSEGASRPQWPGQMTALERGVELFVRRTPGTGAEPAVFVHGLGGSATNWTDLMGLLADRVDGYAPDLPGFGYSPPPRSGYSLDTHVRAVVALIESLDRGPVHLFGNSLGGAAATRLAAERPDLVRTLTLVSPALPVYRPARRGDPRLPLLLFPGISELVLQLGAKTSPRTRAQQLIALVYADPSRIPADRFAESVKEFERRGKLSHTSAALVGSLRGLVRTYVELGGRNLWRQAKRVQAPTLLIWGRQDRLVSVAIARKAAQALRARRLIVLDGVGHVAQMEVPDVVATAVRQHLDASV
jgi:pimeloyl-ACP methyl ester carboxylesterase